MAQNEHLPFVDSIYEIWLSKSVDTNFERFLLRNFCSNAFSECVAFYRLILNELCNASRGNFSTVSYVGSGVWRYDITSIGGYFTFTIVTYMEKKALFIIDLDYPIPLVRPYSTLRENRIVTIKESKLRQIILETLRRVIHTA